MYKTLLKTKKCYGNVKYTGLILIMMAVISVVIIMKMITWEKSLEEIRVGIDRDQIFKFSLLAL